MIENLLENWLDSASERSYQAVFVQMLAADGYTVLHSTRHCLLEFGKDILAIAPDGVGCAFQLKGDPRGQMTVGHFRKEVQPQLVQLMYQCPSYPGFPKEVPHRAYLVSNGQFSEEVQVAAGELNGGNHPTKVELWSRGKLLELCKKYGSQLWPSELEDNRALLELYLANPKDQLPHKTLASVLVSVLALNSDAKPLSKNEFVRAATSAAWLTGLSTATFAEAENHQAVAYAWTICCIFLIGAAEKHQQNVSTMEASYSLAKKVLLDSLASLCEELIDRKYLVEGNALTDPEIYGWRVGVLYGLMTSLSLADAAENILSNESREWLTQWLKSGLHRPDLWGEAAIANMFPWLVWLRKYDATSRPDNEIYSAANAVISANQPKGRFALATPHYDFDEVFRSRYNLDRGHGLNRISRETFAGGSYTAELLFLLLARTNNKSRCKELWSAFTNICNRRFSPQAPWQYCLLHAPNGVDETFIFPPTYSWEALRSDATKKGSCIGVMPAVLASTPWLLAMWWQVVPHRISTEAARLFIDEVLPGWRM